MKQAVRGFADTPLVLIILATVVATAFFAGGDGSMRRIVVAAGVNAIAVVGLYVYIGLTGVFSFGQLAFMAIGAYTTAVLTVPVISKSVLFDGMPEWLVDLNLPTFIAIVVGALLAALVALALSVPMARMGDLTISLGTLAILVAVYVVVGNWSAVTNGSKGITAIPTDTTLPVVLIVLAVVIAGVWFFQESALGLKIRATREDSVAARAIGISIGFHRGVAFVVSAFVVGIAGGLYAHLQGSLSPDAFYIGPTFILIAMLVVGGISTLSGAIIGTLVISALRYGLQLIEPGVELGGFTTPTLPGISEVGLAVALLLILALRRTGLTGGREISAAGFVEWVRGIGRGRRRDKADGRASEETHEEVGA
ncbi:branched-chain amino acid transport system permease protein [Microbacteriaceae bacterium SG_E_30_P1]|uniref:Branched-chain amino acid transport system permease protein n=1 Tax=Antiquaquibacter oligotrophicus TaxID=2880260 RepID=A0ABT6KRI8_9MICO|nr:branched-chain amino acid ABC transporter permease [Antiquaquibacter oligotrophicus]MDH6182456.1 branched-chain amino acid transport system permease protein [Antiquaquibacter oligotrophicus]UDF14573.1 branched-chain amino acid ABC transporter permease [Antiquaquibacter oligotrophicus]